MSAAGPQKVSPELEDPLDYLPHRNAIEYQRNQIIYDERHPSTGLHFVDSGRVKVFTAREDGSETVIGICGASTFFGEGALVAHNSTHHEHATALEKSAVMTWTAAEIEAQIARQPRLGVALLRVLVGRCLHFGERLQSLSIDTTPDRVAKTLLWFARSGAKQPDGSVRILPLTHQLIAGYAGTAREIVTAEMNEWRRRGLVKYSRQAIDIYPERLTQRLSGNEKLSPDPDGASNGMAHQA